jgi:hypothetical protein
MLRQVEVLQVHGASNAEAVRQIGVTQQTFFRYRREYGGMSRDPLERQEELETKNNFLTRWVSVLTIDKMILAEAAQGNL